METTTKKRGLAAMLRLCPLAHALLLSAAGIGLFWLVRGDTALMRRVSLGFVQPLHHSLARVTAPLPFSLAEALIALLSLGVLVYIIYEIVALIRRPGRGARLYRMLVRLLALGLSVYALFCLLWGVYYYGDDFAARSGLTDEAISAEELEAVTIWFAAQLNDYADRVPRDAQGECATDRAAVLAYSPQLMRSAVERFPALDGPEVPAKPIFFSRVMSIIDFTGFFSPFTAEANVNTDFPPALFAATVAHELSHQRGVAKEQEANFVAVLVCLEDGDPDCVYSACMLAYIHLGNALYAVDPGAYRLIWRGLDENVQRDLLANNAYWARFDSPVQSVTDAVYEGFLQSYGQTLGMRSYGACVDLLVRYYCEEALVYLAE